MTNTKLQRTRPDSTEQRPRSIQDASEHAKLLGAIVESLMSAMDLSKVFCLEITSAAGPHSLEIKIDRNEFVCCPIVDEDDEE